MGKSHSVSGWINEKPPRGRYTFTHDEIVSAFPQMGSGTLARSLTREVSKGRIFSPLRGFYVIIPEEYQLRGIAPQSLYLDDLMRHLGRKYYVSLLSAAEMHGAAHQAPMSYCVMIEPPSMRNKKTDKYETLFFCKKLIADLYVEKRQTRTGYLNVSCPELTAVDLITYQTKVGGITRAATVLAELIEKTDFSRLNPDFAGIVPISSLQRLGYICDIVLDERKVAEDIFQLLKHTGVQLQTVPLRVGSRSDGFKKNDRWKVIINVEIEIDEL